MYMLPASTSLRPHLPRRPPLTKRSSSHPSTPSPSSSPATTQPSARRVASVGRGAGRRRSVVGGVERGRSVRNGARGDRRWFGGEKGYRPAWRGSALRVSLSLSRRNATGVGETHRRRARRRRREEPEALVVVPVAGARALLQRGRQVRARDVRPDGEDAVVENERRSAREPLEDMPVRAQRAATHRTGEMASSTASATGAGIEWCSPGLSTSRTTSVASVDSRPT